MEGLIVMKIPEKSEKKGCCGSSARKSVGEGKIEEEGEEESCPPEIVEKKQETARKMERVIAAAEGVECKCDRVVLSVVSSSSSLSWDSSYSSDDAAVFTSLSSESVSEWGNQKHLPSVVIWPTVAAIRRKIRKEKDIQNISSKQQTVVLTPAKTVFARGMECIQTAVQAEREVIQEHYTI
ncbi:uncharacterized protein MONOS_2886 [Monocercomonoides exilis]|uniref:uncharacterized protein n=1 Tax=Monocercomonoides exilis TaxID=2049356 RepID=UPI00355A5A25|nr:hypothetical protein MONOS_2886 [Monocercomonoides exilis]|eukprot:MONOS_2886.1-p1 / transcript=MONOS_2886.1 / gene=MONOS_2886 / organism=Monocercomonoides_exilis_PA203 / gene_product=unspecified product / transcript_product=unspecified product / location=Mono_scaffold00062:152177-153025(-) / protein_length=181 / sequence_SO=supercontig / SO=protein_coding / is_pseudo=false